MPCGHLKQYAVNSAEGTDYCIMCQALDLRAELERVRQELNHVKEQDDTLLTRAWKQWKNATYSGIDFATYLDGLFDPGLDG